MLIAPPLILPREKDTLHLPSNPDLLHPLQTTIKLLLCHLSGNTSQARAFQRQLQMSSYKHGSRVPKNNTNRTYNDGNSTVVNRKLILFQHMSLMEETSWVTCTKRNFPTVQSIVPALHCPLSSFPLTVALLATIPW